MNKDIKIYIAGHRGLVGSAIKRELEKNGYTNIIGKTHSELDLTDSRAVANFFATEKPDWVIQAAAKVGGILGNNTYPVEFMLENLKIQNNIIENSYKSGVKKLLFLGSSCIYPRMAKQPMKEEYLLSDYLEKTNEGYALAKICGIKLCNYYNREYGNAEIHSLEVNIDPYHFRHYIFDNFVNFLKYKGFELLCWAGQDVYTYDENRKISGLVPIEDMNLKENIKGQFIIYVFRKKMEQK